MTTKPLRVFRWAMVASVGGASLSVGCADVFGYKVYPQVDTSTLDSGSGNDASVPDSESITPDSRIEASPVDGLVRPDGERDASDAPAEVADGTVKQDVGAGEVGADTVLPDALETGPDTPGTLLPDAFEVGPDTTSFAESSVPDGGGACISETAATFCSRLGRDCGVFTGYDNCGVGRSANCGTCSAPKVCGADNVCACPPESNATFCSRLGKDCGTVTGPDNCGTSRTVNCGGCAAPKTCGATNVCACVPESASDFCTRLGKNCGSVTAPDICGTTVTYTCGTCASTEACGNKNVCVVPLACTGRNEPVSLTFYDFTGSPSPTPTGGTIVDGYYSATKITAYGTVESAVGGTLEFRSGFLRRVHTTYSKTGSALTGWTEEGTYTNTNTSVAFTVRNCSYGGGYGTQSFSYTSSATQFRLFETIQGKIVVTQYDLQP